MDFIDFEKKAIESKKFSVYTNLRSNEATLQHERKMVDLKLAENYISMLDFKKTLYDMEYPALINFYALCKNVASWIDDVTAKKINKRTACDGKNAHKELISILNKSFGFEAKEITKIAFEGYNAYKIWIYFTDKRTKEKLVLRVPNLRSSYFNISTATLIRLEEDPSKYLDDLKRKVTGLDASVLGLLVQKEDDSWYTITSFPGQSPVLSDLGRTYYSKNLSAILDDILKEETNEDQGN